MQVISIEGLVLKLVIDRVIDARNVISADWYRRARRVAGRCSDLRQGLQRRSYLVARFGSEESNKTSIVEEVNFEKGSCAIMS